MRPDSALSSFSYNVLFNSVFDPIALYHVRSSPLHGLPADDELVLDGTRKNQQSGTPGNPQRGTQPISGIFFVDVNPAYERVMNIKREDVIGRSFIDVWPNAEKCWSRIITDCLDNTRTESCESISRDAGRYLEAIAFPLPEDHAAVIFLDKTELRKSDTALKNREEMLRALVAKLTLSEENTRREIADDIHDRMGCELVTQLNRLRRLSESSLPPDVASEISDIAKRTEKLIAESRSLIFELSPPVLKEVGLNPALEALARNMLGKQGIHWSFRSKGTIEEFDADDAVCIILYRMTRELLMNVIKHSGADMVNIIVNRGPQKIMVAVEDNGKGFSRAILRHHNSINDKANAGSSPPKNASLGGTPGNPLSGFGLFSIHERLQAIGGEFRIVSQPGKGATVAMSCPLRLRSSNLGEEKDDA